MDYPIEVHRKLIPETTDVLEERFRILNYIKSSGPIGRRLLGEIANLSERESRTMIELLRKQQLIKVARNGVTISEEGLKVLQALESVMNQWTGLTTFENALRTKLNIRQVTIVEGNSDKHPSVKNSMAREAAKDFLVKVKNKNTVAVTGGSTIAAIPSYLEAHTRLNNLFFVAARGGVGANVGFQANVIAASFADAVDGEYEAFFYPETVSEEAHRVFQKEPSVQKMMRIYDQVDCVFHGIGEALEMANMRNSSQATLHKLQEQDARGEAFGHYFNRSGDVVHRIQTIGIQTEQMKRVPLIYAVAGGQKKAKAILAYLSKAPKQTILITDEAAAEEMLRYL